MVCSMTTRNSGHIHILGLFFALLVLGALISLWDWQRKALSLHDQVLRMEQELEKLDAKVKFLELKVDTLELGKPKSATAQP